MPAVVAAEAVPVRGAQSSLSKVTHEINLWILASTRSWGLVRGTWREVAIQARRVRARAGRQLTTTVQERGDQVAAAKSIHDHVRAVGDTAQTPDAPLLHDCEDSSAARRRRPGGARSRGARGPAHVPQGLAMSHRIASAVVEGEGGSGGEDEDGDGGGGGGARTSHRIARRRSGG